LAGGAVAPRTPPMATPMREQQCTLLS